MKGQKKRHHIPVMPIIIGLLIVLLVVLCAQYIKEQNEANDPVILQSQDQPKEEDPLPASSGVQKDAPIVEENEEEDPGTPVPPEEDPEPQEETPPVSQPEEELDLLQISQQPAGEPLYAKGEALSYFDDAVFIGDSLTQGLDLYGVLPNASYIASQGINPQTIHGSIVLTDGRTVTVLEELARVPHKKIYVMLGANGIAWMDKNTIISQYEILLSALKQAAPDSQIFVQSILPVTAEKSKDERYANSKIEEYNSALKKMAQGQQVIYLDVAAALKDASGALPHEASPSDGMHFTTPYYQKWVDCLAGYAVQSGAVHGEDEPVSPSHEEEIPDTEQPPDEKEHKKLVLKDFVPEKETP